MKAKLTSLLVLTWLLGTCFPGAILAGTAKSKSDSTFTIRPDDPIAAMLDSLIRLNYFEKVSANDPAIKSRKFPADSIPVYADEVYAARIAKLNANSPFHLDYNKAVRDYIDMYANRKRAMVSRMMGLAKVYFPLFEETLDKYNLPLELKYLAIVESALNPTATSRSGAKGLWQFMYPTGKMYKLNVTSYVDDRCDPFKATVAACEYFQDLYAMFGDWQLVLAAYNGGPGTLNKAIRRSGGKKNYWELRPYLPVETRGYVPAFIAVNYVMNYTEEHNLYAVPVKPVYTHIDTVQIKNQIRFDQIAAVLNVPMEDLTYLNPAYRKNLIPYNEKCYTLCLPADKVGGFINNETAIVNYMKDPERIVELPDPVFVKQENVKYHIVKKGEHLSTVAKKYHCSVSDIKEWNRLKSNKLMRGQKLKIVKVEQVEMIASKQSENKEKEVNSKPVVAASGVKEHPVLDSAAIAAQEERNIEDLDKKEPELNQPVVNVAGTKKASNAKSTKAENKYKYHVVQKGDTLWSIANRSGLTVDQLKELNRINNAKSLKPGTKIKVGVSS